MAQVKRLVTTGLAAVLALWTVSAFAAPKKDDKAAAKPAAAPAAKAAAKPAGKAAEASAHGPIKGAVNGKMFTVASSKGETKVDASKATLRVNGKFASASELKPGTMVTAKGTMDGGTLKATNVDIFPRKGAKKDEPKGKAPDTKTPAPAPAPKKK
jgi:hypothetical protein